VCEMWHLWESKRDACQFWWGYLKEIAKHIWEANIKIRLRYSWRVRTGLIGIGLERSGGVL